MADAPPVDPATLENLPVEVIVQIFCLLSDFPALFSTITACPRLRDVYQTHSQRILGAILGSVSDNAPSGPFTLVSPRKLKPSLDCGTVPIYAGFVGLLQPLPFETLLKIGFYEGYLWQFYRAIPRHVLVPRHVGVIFNTLLGQVKSGNRHIIHALIPFGRSLEDVEES
ncbi:hypothetical protein LZ30DRAFT_710739 [Colletotrichum cereale]|nr:hypothetical protein LZ30DRAFT_710739 [Colletotrichum cereale]